MRRADASEARSAPKASGGREAGLTLLEVLGAVALLGILYTVLSGKAIEGLRSEGESRRRLEASLLADDRLSGIELALASGVVPAIGASEEELDGFTVVTDVRAFELPPPAPAPVDAEPRSLAARRAAARSKDAPSLLAPSRTTPDAQPLRSIEVVVRWLEGIAPREVRRTTWALDREAVEALFASLPQSPAGKRPGAQDAGKDQGSRQGGGGASRRQRQEQTTPPLPNFEPPTGDGSGEEP